MKKFFLSFSAMMMLSAAPSRAESFTDSLIYTEAKEDIEKIFPELTKDQAEKCYMTEEEYVSYMKDLPKIRAFAKKFRNIDFDSNEEADRWMKEQNYGGISKLSLIAIGKLIFSQINWNF